MSRACPKCGGFDNEEFPYCPECGKRLRDPQPAPRSRPYYTVVQPSVLPGGGWVELTPPYDTPEEALQTINMARAALTGESATAIVLIQENDVKPHRRNRRRMIVLQWVPLRWEAEASAWTRTASTPDPIPTIDIVTEEVGG